MKQPFFNRSLLISLLIGLTLRLLFFFFGAELYYGTEQFYIGGDTYSFLEPAKNLVDHGVLTLDPENPDAAFSRLPGFPLLLAAFYLLFGDTTTFFFAVCFFQILLDSLSIALVYHIAFRLFKNERAAFISSLLYAVYPFIIVWTATVYAETSGIFVVLLMVYFLGREKRRYWLLTGMLVGIGFFIRPQLLFLLPALLLPGFLISGTGFHKKAVLIMLGFLLIYLPWPLRNYVNHGKLVPFRDISAMRAWQDDVMNFHEFMTSIQVDWEPQMTQLISGTMPVFPEEAYPSEEDSLKLLEAIRMSQTCSDGFASFMKRPVLENNCTQETAERWLELQQIQKSKHPLNYYLVVPLKGLMKSIFKIKLITNWKSPERSTMQTLLISSLFLWRTLWILTGLVSGILLLRKKTETYTTGVILAYFFCWYGWLCFISRYLEMRYFLPADVMLLIPAGYGLHLLIDRLTKHKPA